MAFDLMGAASSLIGGGTDSLSGVGSLIGSAVPLPFASQIGGALGSLAGGLGLDRIGKKAADASPMIQKISDNSGFTTEQVTAACAYQEQTSKDHFDDICEYAARTPGRIEQLVEKYNSAHPTGKIVKNANSYYAQIYQPGVQLGEAIPQLTSVRAALAQQGISSQVIEPAPASTPDLVHASTTVVESAPAPTSNSFAGLSKEEIQAIIKSGGAGLQKGIIDGAMNTSIGKQAQDSGAKQWANDNGLVIGGVVAVLGMGFTYLIATRK